MVESKHDVETPKRTGDLATAEGLEGYFEDNGFSDMIVCK